MKKITKQFLGLALVGLILGGCSQTATFEDADLMNEQAAAEKAGFNLNPFGTGNLNARIYSSTDCENFCIDPENPEYSLQTAQINNNSGPQTRIFTYTVYNTLSGFQLDWSYSASNNAGRKLKITVSGAGFSSPKTYTSAQLNGGPASGSNTFTFDASWSACGVVTVVAEILDGNNVLVSGPITTTYSLIGECSDCDEESLSYEASNENLDVIFSYNYSEEAEMTLTFTLPQAKIVLPTGATYIGSDGKSYKVGGNGTNLTWTGMVSCSNEEPTTFEFEFAADCGPSTAKDGKANIWTNTEVKAINGVDLVDDPNTPDNEGPYSLKEMEGLSNIVFTGCPITK